jgi:hypothetical protein
VGINRHLLKYFLRHVISCRIIENCRSFNWTWQFDLPKIVIRSIAVLHSQDHYLILVLLSNLLLFLLPYKLIINRTFDLIKFSFDVSDSLLELAWRT